MDFRRVYELEQVGNVRETHGEGDPRGMRGGEIVSRLFSPTFPPGVTY